MESEQRYTRYQDIPQFTRAGQWECDYAPNRLIPAIDKFIKEDNLDIDPDFQRGHVWTEKKQREYIEFFLRGGKSARVIYLNHPRWSGGGIAKPGEFVLVDGKQRLEAWRKFYAGELRVFGSLVSEFTDNLREMSNSLRLNINELKTRAEVLRWYLQMNSCGVIHTEEELEKVRVLLEAEKKKVAK